MATTRPPTRPLPTGTIRAGGRIRKSTQHNPPNKITTSKLAALMEPVLTEPGWLLRIDLKYMGVLRDPREKMTRTIRVPKTMTFHQLHEILVRAFGWNSSAREGTNWSSDGDYSFLLYERKAKPLYHGTPESPKVMLGPDAPPGQVFWKSSKVRTLAQVFDGGDEGELWPEVPARVEYQLYLVEVEDELEDQREGANSDGSSDGGGGVEFVPCWDYTIHFLGETSSTLTDRPGQEVFCTEGTGHPREADLERGCPASQLDQRGQFCLDHVNDILGSWCPILRSQQNIVARARARARQVADEDVR